MSKPMSCASARVGVGAPGAPVDVGGGGSCGSQRHSDGSAGRGCRGSAMGASGTRGTGVAGMGVKGCMAAAHAREVVGRWSVDPAAAARGVVRGD